MVQGLVKKGCPAKKVFWELYNTGSYIFIPSIGLAPFLKMNSLCNR